METKLRDVVNTDEAMEPGPELDHYLLEEHEEKISGSQK